MATYAKLFYRQQLNLSIKRYVLTEMDIVVKYTYIDVGGNFFEHSSEPYQTHFSFGIYRHIAISSCRWIFCSFYYNADISFEFESLLDTVYAHTGIKHKYSTCSIFFFNLFMKSADIH